MRSAVRPAAVDVLPTAGFTHNVTASRPAPPTEPAAAESLVSALRDLARPGDDCRILDRHLACEDQINAGRPLQPGNAVTLLQNGPDTYDAMFEAIGGARDHVNLETYIFDDGPIGRRFAQALAERARAGVRVNVIYDSVGTLVVPDTFFQSMREAGIHLLEFHPINPARRRSRLLRLNNRDHRKLLIVDGRIAFVGGINISETYSSVPSVASQTPDTSGTPKDDGGWRDTHLRIQGPAVAQFQRLFVDTWGRHGSGALDGPGYFPEPAVAGQALVRALSSDYDDDRNQIFATLQSAIAHAGKQVQLTVAYFAPDRPLLKVLRAAARRGVEVDMVMPGCSDSWPIFHLGRSYYGRLLRAGVRIHERRGPVMHSKTAMIDGVWSTVGSANLDWRSMLHNNEANAVVVDREFAAQMNTMFAADLAASDRIDRRRWRRRPIRFRCLEFVSRLMAYFL